MQYEKSATLTEDLETGGTRKPRSKFSALNFISRTFLQAFSLTFLAEWGDRSQLTTIILAAREVSASDSVRKAIDLVKDARTLHTSFLFQNIYGVTMGGVVGHSICTGLAVIGGRMIAQRISVRTGRFSLFETPTSGLQITTKTDTFDMKFTSGRTGNVLRCKDKPKSVA